MALVRDTVHQHIIVNVMDVAVQFHVILHNVQNVIHIQSVIDVITVDTIIAYARTVDTVALVDALVVQEETLEEVLVEVQRCVLLVEVVERQDTTVADTQV